MDKEQRGRLMVEREELVNNIRKAKTILQKKANALSDFAQALLSNPRNVGFIEAPDEVGKNNNPHYVSDKTTFNWNDISGILEIALLVREIQTAEDRLENINDGLRS